MGGATTTHVLQQPGHTKTGSRDARFVPGIHLQVHHARTLPDTHTLTHTLTHFQLLSSRKPFFKFALLTLFLIFFSLHLPVLTSSFVTVCVVF